MPGQSQDAGNSEGAREHGEGRGSIGRAFSRLRAAIKRRRSSNNPVTTTPSKSTPEEPINCAPSPSVAVETTSTDLRNSVENTADVQSARDTLVNGMGVQLVVDTDENTEVDDTAEPLLPMLSTRTGLSKERASKLFEKYGIKYESRTTLPESGLFEGIRRVEKPIRIRIHWTCHDCNSSFGYSKTCMNCGHRRCRECPRAPSKRVREVLETATQRQEQEEQGSAAPIEQNAGIDLPVAGGHLDNPVQATMPEVSPTLQVDQENIPSGEDVDSQYQYVFQQRPQSGINLVLRPKPQIVRWKCHECETHFKPASRMDCQNCGHIRCSLCPREPLKREDRTPESTEDDRPGTEEPRMVATVQRVFKKPRQRVRWICDQCQGQLVDRERCRDCGHQRCGACTRTPAKRIPPTPDPAILQSVIEKLTDLREQSLAAREAMLAGNHEPLLPLATPA